MQGLASWWPTPGVNDQVESGRWRANSWSHKSNPLWATSGRLLYFWRWVRRYLQRSINYNPLVRWCFPDEQCSTSADVAQVKAVGPAETSQMLIPDKVLTSPQWGLPWLTWWLLSFRWASKPELSSEQTRVIVIRVEICSTGHPVITHRHNAYLRILSGVPEFQPGQTESKLNDLDRYVVFNTKLLVLFCM